MDFRSAFETLTGNPPFKWQARLFNDCFSKGELPSALDLPTGLGKTSVMAIWLIARAQGAQLPRRLVYVVDRRAVVDQATAEAEKLRAALDGAAREIKAALGLKDQSLPISTMRGQFVDNRDWLADPAAPAIVLGTVDMIGSRILFEGYGVSRKMRPYNAGLLGADALIVLDEAHLVPPFAHLLRAIERDAKLSPKADAERSIVPRLHLLPLSATLRNPGGAKEDRRPFRLKEGDEDDLTKRRINAKKRLKLLELDVNSADAQLAKAAWDLASKDGEFSRIVVFCDRRDKKEDGRAATAQGVKEEIEKLAKGDKKADRPRTAIHAPELLVGARRVREREHTAARLRTLGFIGDNNNARSTLDKPAFLIATSAGEVGVDLDAEHLVCDLVAWERMVQRLGRVNRRGRGEAEVVVFWSKPEAKKPDEPTEAERRAQTAFAAKAVLERLSAIVGDDKGGLDASPRALRDLSEMASNDAKLKDLIEAATTPEPLRPALNRALVDAWSMTSLETHTGRPEIAPWLRGWVKDELPQTTLVWRTHLPARPADEQSRADASDTKDTTHPDKKEIREIENFFEAAAPHASEKLETETWRVIDWLQRRAKEFSKGAALAKNEVGISDQPVDGDPEAGETVGGEAIADHADAVSPPISTVKRDTVVAIAITAGGDFSGRYTRGDLTKERDSNAKKRFEAELYGKTLVVDARMGGLNAGLLDPDADGTAEAADTLDAWSIAAGFRVRIENAKAEDTAHLENDWRYEDEFVLRQNEDGNTVEKLIVEHLKQAARNEDARSISRPQSLAEHQSWAEEKAKAIATGVGLEGEYALPLAIAARLHDEGKRAKRWQRAFNANKSDKALDRPLAKTKGPIDQAILDGYRHEFGSLPYAENDAGLKALSADLQDLVLHLIASHHGGARPVIDTRGCEDAPPSALQQRACDVALRFARLQKQWGPWGLAWWEALLRAADQQASRDNDETPRTTGSG
ncbi:MAG: type I-U CRISPR-associated helicase/endonuclease Cas3 [Parvularculaceae bacterium]